MCHVQNTIDEVHHAFGHCCDVRIRRRGGCRSQRPLQVSRRPSRGRVETIRATQPETIRATQPSRRFPARCAPNHIAVFPKGKPCPAAACGQSKGCEPISGSNLEVTPKQFPSRRPTAATVKSAWDWKNGKGYVPPLVGKKSRSADER